MRQTLGDLPTHVSEKVAEICMERSIWSSTAGTATAVVHRKKQNVIPSYDRSIRTLDNPSEAVLCRLTLAFRKLFPVPLPLRLRIFLLSK